MLSSLPLVYGDATTQHEGERGKQKENRDKDLRTVRFRSGQVGGDWLVKSRKDTRTDVDEQRERKVGPQLPGLDETGRGVFIRFEIERATMYATQEK